MSEGRQLQVLLEQASTQRRLGNWRGAIDLGQRALSLDPDHAIAHASLALSLLGARRVAGASLEVNVALGLEGNDPYIHYVAAAVARAERRLPDALAHVEIAIQADAHDLDARVLGADIRVLRNEVSEARTLLDEALALSPAHVDALVSYARLELHANNPAAAMLKIELSLSADPSDIDAHIVAGHIDLVRGDAASAEGHARYVLNQDATNQAGLRLWASIKARRSIFLGLWWRFNVALSMRSERSQLVYTIGGFVLVRLLVIAAKHFDLISVARGLSYAWLAFCAYTWLAPSVFRWMLKSDLGTVKLDPDY